MTTTTDAYEAGYLHGRNAGAWVFDGDSSTEDGARVLKGYDEGDPVVMDMMPAPLSGEWAGESIPELSERYGVDLADEGNADDDDQGATTAETRSLVPFYDILRTEEVDQ